MANRDKIKDIKIDLWTDDSRSDVVCSYSFQGWISRYHINSSGDANHTLSLSLFPSLTEQQYQKIEMSN